jgi:hypothetical protein
VIVRAGCGASRVFAVRALVGQIFLGLVLAGCLPGPETGYVEIRTVPVSAPRAPSLYLDNTRLDPVQKGIAVLKQRIGTTKLAIEGFGGQPNVLCDIEVKKNRVTTVTVSVMDRPPRCQCRNSNASRVCVS